MAKVILRGRITTDAQPQPASLYNVSQMRDKAVSPQQPAGSLPTRLRQTEIVIKTRSIKTRSRDTLTVPMQLQHNLRVRKDRPFTAWSGRLRSGAGIISSPIQSSPSTSLRWAASAQIHPDSALANTNRSQRLQRRNRRKNRTAAQIAGVQKAKLTRHKNKVARAAILAAARAKALAAAVAAQAAQAAQHAAAEQYRLTQEQIGIERLRVFKERLVYTVPSDLPPISEKERNEVEEILERFARNCRDYTPLRIQRVCNDILDTKFEEMRQSLQKRGRNTDEVFMFHGTAEGNIKKIMTDGFKIGGVDGHPIAHGTSLGKGVYTAKSPGHPISYTFGGSKLLAVRTLPGTRRIGPGNITMEWQKNDSNDNGLGEILVFRTPDQCLPCYIVYFASTHQVDPDAARKMNVMYSYQTVLQSAVVEDASKIIVSKIGAAGSLGV